MLNPNFSEQLIGQIRLLLLSTWERRFDIRTVEIWLEQFQDDFDPAKSPRVQALFLLSQFMYFGSFEIRALLRSIYRDHFKYPVIERLRQANGMTKDRSLLSNLFASELDQTRFVGFGNPSESSYHLLYYFRQENHIPKYHFITPDQIFILVQGQAQFGQAQIFAQIRTPAIRNYVFIDDLCGSGAQAREYATDKVIPLKSLAAHSKHPVRTWYLALFGTSAGLEQVRQLGCFDEVSCVVELDESFKCFGPVSRYFANEESPVNQVIAEQMCRDYGLRLVPHHPLGYRDGQLLLSFAHNTPDNTLPIFHHEPGPGSPVAWTPIFKRFPKF